MTKYDTAHECFISFKTQDVAYKEAIQEMGINMVDKSLDEAIDSDDPDYIMQKIRDDYLSLSTVTIHLIGTNSSENLGLKEQQFIKRELQASLYNGKNNSRSGILGIVLPDMYSSVYQGNIDCNCGEKINIVKMDDAIVIKEFHKNYYIHDGKCHHTEDDRYCVLVKWGDFCSDPKKYIEQAFLKREHAIAEHITVYP